MLVSGAKRIPAADEAMELEALDFWADDGFLEIARNFFEKRGGIGSGLTKRDRHDQMRHDYHVLSAVRRAGFHDAEFVGYEDDSHPFSKRDGVHPFAPRIRFTHPTGDRLVATTRDTNTSTHITLSPWFEEHEEHHLAERAAQFRHERLNNGLIEGRFDRQAQNADPNQLMTDATDKQAFRVVEDSLKCFYKEKNLNGWPPGATFDMQMYDNTNKETFGYGSIGVFPNDESTAVVGLQPQPPLTGGQNC